MKQVKKALATLLVTVLLLTSMPLVGLTAFAAGPMPAEESVSVVSAYKPRVIVDSKTVKAGDEFSINVSLKNNPGIVSAKVLVEYDTADFEMVSAVGGDFDGVQFGVPNTSPFVINWVDSLHPNNTTDGVLATLTFRVKAGVAGGDYPITVRYDEEDIHDDNLDNVEFITQDGTVTVQCSEHSFGDAVSSSDTQHRKTCLVCGHIEFADHDYANACDTDCSVCRHIRAVGNHVYDSDVDSDCNECGATREVTFTGWHQEGGKWAYYQNGVKIVNDWMKDSYGWCYLGADGYMVTDQWLKDSVGWCYVGSNGYCVTNRWMQDSVGWVYLDGSGRMMTNAWMKDSAGWCYLGADGYCVTNQWKQDSVGWCYLDANGRMATNQWLKDSVGWCYVGADGYCVTSQWKRDSVGWVYLNASGRMVTDAWVRDSVGWCYVGGDGYAVTNCWKRDSVGWCYLNANGSMTKSSWVPDGGKWYYCDASGYMLASTSRYIGGKTYHFNASGVCTNP